MQPGDKVIYFKTYNFEPPPARIGTLLAIFPDGFAVVATEPDGPGRTTVRDRRVYPYTEALWTAWQQWQQNAKLLDQQHKQLMAGKAPAELLNLNLY